ncbi:MAG: hypothetical protein KDA05_12855 [Phycisphaerales bacterium]|nr:hypothetical protein [Phycisphaerales bacterium]
MAKASRLPTKPTEAPPSLAKRLRACAEHLETFAGTVPLVFTFREGEDLHCSTSRVGPQAPEAYTCLDHFYAAIKEIDSAIVDLGLRGPDGQSPPPMTVMNWADWPHLLRGATPSHKRLFSLGKSLVGWWSSNRRQGNYKDGPHQYGHYWAIDANSAEFATRAAAEARAIAKQIFPAKRNSPKQPVERTPEDIRQSTPALNTNSPNWVPLKEAAQRADVQSKTLGDHRRDGWTDEDEMLGRDTKGRVWRRAKTRRSHPWYLEATIEKVLDQPVDKKGGSTDAAR